VPFPKRGSPKERSKRAVLLVDDDAGAAKVVSWILSQNNCRVAYFQDPRKALKAFKRNVDRFQVVIVDIHMPAMTGFEFARHIRKLCSETRIILLTDFKISKSEFLRVFPSSKINEIIAKPTEPRELMQAVTGVRNYKSNDNHSENGSMQGYQKVH
jgi:DNA-binding response OmpR family regulator